MITCKTLIVSRSLLADLGVESSKNMSSKSWNRKIRNDFSSKFSNINTEIRRKIRYAPNVEVWISISRMIREHFKNRENQFIEHYLFGVSGTFWGFLLFLHNHCRQNTSYTGWIAWFCSIQVRPRLQFYFLWKARKIFEMKRCFLHKSKFLHSKLLHFQKIVLWFLLVTDLKLIRRFRPRLPPYFLRAAKSTNFPFRIAQDDPFLLVSSSILPRSENFKIS